MHKMILSGPADIRDQVVVRLQQKGCRVEHSRDTVRSNRGPVPLHEYNHGFEQADGEAFVTAYGDVGMVAHVGELGWNLRMHLVDGSEGEWANNGRRSVPQTGDEDPFKKIAELEARIRAAGIVLP